MSGLLKYNNGQEYKILNPYTTLTGSNTSNSTNINSQIEGVLSNTDIASRPNLLDNWYFADPVNTRGFTSKAAGAATSYYMDRWTGGHTVPAYTLTSEGIEIKHSNLTEYTWMYQIIDEDLFKQLTGKKFTYSMLYRKLDEGYMPYGDGRISTILRNSGSSVSGITALKIENKPGWQIASQTCLFNQLPDTDINKPRIIIYSNIIVKAVKLELGEGQTLAHLEDGKWVLNEIPDKGIEMFKCYTSKADSNDNFTGFTFMPISATNSEPTSASSVPKNTIIAKY